MLHERAEEFLFLSGEGLNSDPLSTIKTGGASVINVTLISKINRSFFEYIGPMKF